MFTRNTNSSRGFTLVELAIVVLILGILAVVAVPMLVENTDEAKLTATMRSLQGIQRAAESYFAEKGQWPPDAIHGVCPPQLRPYLRCNVFRHDPPIGGLYDWSYNYASFPFKANIGIYYLDKFPRADCVALDRMFDDGNVSKGDIRITGTDGGTGRLLLQVEAW